ncbi:MAG: response regulator [Candidatus Margulisiibacteriota bacterium]|jgi:DNA-binding NtrC family response regulator
MNKLNKIIIVDDEENIVEALKLVVQQMNLEPFGFYDADSFVNYLKKVDTNEIILVIMDIMLDGTKSGIDALKEMALVDDKIPAVVLTAYADWNIVDRDKKFLANIPLLQKPIDLEKLTKIINLTQKKRSLNEK